MTHAPDLPTIDPYETRSVSFDFSPNVQIGDYLTGIPTVTCTVTVGVDATPSSRLLGSPTEASRAVVRQSVGTCLSGVTYQLTCSSQTFKGETLTIRVNLPCAT